jgi:hypothetical protein
MKTLDELMEDARRHAVEVLVGKPDASLMPTWLMQTPKGAIVVGTPWTNDDEKDLVAFAMRHMLKKEHATSYSFLSEAWVVTQGIGEPYIQPRLSDKRREVVIINAFTREQGRVRIYEIKRGPDAVVTELTPESDLDGADHFGGRLHNLFQPEDSHAE